MGRVEENSVAKGVTLRDLRKYMKRWQSALRLQDWEMRIDWATEAQMAERLGEDGDCPKSGELAKQAVACTDASNAYQSDTSFLENKKNRILVKINKKLTKKEAESIVLHEMLHVLLWHMAPNDSDASATILLEQVINTLESVIMNGDRNATR